MNSAKLRKIILEELSMSHPGRNYRRSRKLGLADYLDESSGHHLLELDDDSIISTGLRIHEELGDSDGTDDGDDHEVVDSALGTGTSDEPVVSAPIAVEEPVVNIANPESDLASPSLPVTVPPAPASVNAPVETHPPADVDDSSVAASTMDVSGDDSDDSAFAADADVPPTSDGLGDSIMNSLLAGAAGEEARRRGSAGVTTPTIAPSSTDTAGPEATSNITDKRALSTYLDQVARGERSITLESRKIEITSGGPRNRPRFQL